jgi:acyl-CoA hydrolase
MTMPPNHELSMTVLMTPDMANFGGNVHGGHLLKLLDQVAYACASRYCGRYVVTVSVDQVLFRQPIHTGRSSMEIGIKVLAEDIRNQQQRHVNSCYFTMVAVDDEGRPAPVSALVPCSEVQAKRHREAVLRKSARLTLGRELAATVSLPAAVPGQD